MANRKAASTTDRPLVCVIGSDEFNMALISEMKGAEAWDVRPILTLEDVEPASNIIEFDDLYDRAADQIAALDRAPDAIVGHLDFPVTALVAMLSRDHGLGGPTPEAIARLEHKYWMRKLEAEAFPEDGPKVTPINPFDPDGAADDAPDYPFWLKPIKAHSSVLGFLIQDREALDEALHEARRAIHQFGSPFNEFLDRLRGEQLDGLPDVDGNWLIAEELISAPTQFTIEGFIKDGKAVAYGVIASLRSGPHTSNLTRYQYPADIPEETVERGRARVEGVLNAAKFDNGVFNVEFFWDPETGELNLLEINPRISKSHSPLFHMVDGASHHKQAIQLALGQTPELPAGEGRDKVAAKFMYRTYEADGIVKRVPTEDELQALGKLLPDLKVQVLVQKNDRLSELVHQDSYSYELMDIFLGAETPEMLDDAYKKCRDSLDVLIKPLPEAGQ